MPTTFTGGSPLPAVGSAAYKYALNASGSGSYDPKNDTMTTPQGSASFGGGSEPAVMSTDSGKKDLNAAIDTHNTQISGMSSGNQTTNSGGGSYGGDANPKADQSFIKAFKGMGAVTANEAAATGVDLKNYRYDSESGLYIPNAAAGGAAGTDSSGLGSQFLSDKKTIDDSFAGQMANMDAATFSLISSLKGMYNARIEAQMDINKRELQGFNTTNIRSGTDRYAPGVAQSILTADENEGLKRIAAIEAEMMGKISEAQDNLTDKKYSAFMQNRSEVDKLRTEYNSKLKDLQDKATEATKEQTTRKQALDDKLSAAITDAAKEAVKNGAPASVVKTIQSATTSADAYAAAAGYGGGANIDIENVKNPDGSTSIVRVDKNTGKIIGTTNIGGGDGDNGGGGGSGDLTPNDYKDFIVGLTPEGANNFAKLSPTDQSNVKQLLNGDALLSDLFASKGVAGSAARQQALKKAQAVDPTFSENVNKQRYTFKTKWNDPNTGVGKVNNSINTALGHLADTKQSSDALDNEGLNFINKTSNWWNVQTGNSSVLKLNTDINALASEVATIYKNGAQPSEPEIENWRGVLSAQYSKGQMSAVENEVSKLLTSKITASRYQYKTAMGKDLSTPIIDPDKKQALLDAGIDPSSIAKENTPGAPKTGVSAKIESALSSTNPVTNKPYTAKDVVDYLKNDPQYKDKIDRVLGKPDPSGHIVTEQDIVDFLKEQ